MPVVALSEIGLIIDVFGQKPKVVKSVDYVMSNNIIVSYFNNFLKFISLPCMEITEIEFQKIKEMKISQDGSFLAIKSLKNSLTIFEKQKIIFERENVDEFGITNEYFYYTSENEFAVQNIVKNEIIFRSETIPKQIVALSSDIFVLNEDCELLLFRGCQSLNIYANENNAIANSEFINVEDSIKQVDKPHLVYKYKSASKLIINECAHGYLILSETSYSSITYFAQLSLHYFVKMSDGSFKILHYLKLGDILHVELLKDEFLVVYGGQPATCSLFSKTTGIKTGSLKKATRNFVTFNNSKRRALCGAYGNLPGIVTVFENNVKTCEFESLGSSVFKWMNDGTHFMVATLNYFKEGNKIDIYDYYGRKTETMECKSLYKVDLYGEPEEEKTLEKPKIPVIIKKQELFVIPELNDYESKSSKKENDKKSKNKKKQEPKKVTKENIPVRTIETVEKELAQAKEARKKLQSGAECSLDEQNLAFSVNLLETEYAKLQENKN